MGLPYQLVEGPQIRQGDPFKKDDLFARRQIKKLSEMGGIPGDRSVADHMTACIQTFRDILSPVLLLHMDIDHLHIAHK